MEQKAKFFLDINVPKIAHFKSSLYNFVISVRLKILFQN